MNQEPTQERLASEVVAFAKLHGARVADEALWIETISLTIARMPRIAPDLTETELSDWLKAKAASYKLEGLRFCLNEWSHMKFGERRELRIYADWADDRPMGAGYSFDEAVADLVKKTPTPEALAADLRKQAKEMLERAESVFPSQSVNPPS